MEISLKHGSLIDVLIGTNSIIEDILDELEQEELRLSKSKEPVQTPREADLTEDMKAYFVQGTSISPIAYKDLQAFKAGSKQSAFAMSSGAKRILLKSESPFDMSKFVIGFVIQEGSEKNIILPDAVELSGGCVEDVDSAKTRALRKICDLLPIEDQNYAQLGVRLFGVNFDCIKRHYRNQSCNLLEVKVKSSVLPSGSDVLEGNQKGGKNLGYQVSFIAAEGYRNY